MKKQTREALFFTIIVLFTLTALVNVYSSNVRASINSNPAISVNADGSIVLVDSNSWSTYTQNFTVFGNTYTAVIVTNSELTNVTMTNNGIGIQFQAAVPAGTTGFCNITLPSILVGSDIAVSENGILLEKNVAYTEERNGENYLFHLTFDSGTHTFVVEAATVSPSQSNSPTSSGIPIETVAIIAGVGTAAAASIAGAIYGIKHAMISKAAGAAGGGGSHGGGGGNNTPSSAGGGGSANVATGTNIAVQPHPNVHMQFSHVNTAGVASANPISIYPKPPGGIPFLGMVFDIKTTAVFTGLVMVGVLFDGKGMSEKEKKKLRVYRNDPDKEGKWEDVTSSIDTKNNIAYGATDHFSIFGVR
jgi:hypothetical protein